MQSAAPSDPSPRSALIDGYDVAFSVQGAPGTTILAIPGLPGSSRDFRWLAPVLAAAAEVVRFDPPGYGRTPRGGYVAMDAPAKARLVLALLDYLRRDRVVLLGHSFGCVVAAHAAAMRPRAVSHLVLLAPPGVTAHFPVGPVRLASGVLAYQAGRRLLRGVQRRGYAMAGFPSFLTDEELTMTSLDSGAADFRGYRAALLAAHPPTLLAWAMDDRQVPPRSSAALHRYVGSGPRVAFTSGGHNIQKTRAMELGRIIGCFVDP